MTTLTLKDKEVVKLVEAINGREAVQANFDGHVMTQIETLLHEAFPKKVKADVLLHGFTASSMLKGGALRINNCKIEITTGTFLGEFTSVDVYPKR